MWRALIMLLLRPCLLLKKSDFQTFRVRFYKLSVIRRGLVLHYQSRSAYILDWEITIRVFYKLEFTLTHANVRYLWALIWPHYPPPETQLRLHNPLGLSWELKSSSTGPQLWAKTAETARPKLTQMVQSPPHSFWYIFYVNINVRFQTCWKLLDNT